MAKGSHADENRAAFTLGDAADPVQRIAELNRLIKHHKHLYYNETPEISDAEYDALEEELRQLVERYPHLGENAAEKVGAPVSGELFAAVRHRTPMLSLDKVHSEEGLREFLARFPGRRFSCWPKFDGVSLSLVYEQGKLVRAATRGDGHIGEDVTQNVTGIVGVHRTLPKALDCEIRGEVVMLKSDWIKYNEAHPEQKLANPRNGATGTLRAKDRDKVKGRRLRFFPFDIIIYNGPQQDCRKLLLELGLHPERYFESTDPDEIVAYTEQMRDARPDLDYEIDGVVVRLADREEYEAAGLTGHHPKGAMALKFPAEIGETTLLDVIWQVGKSGVVAPVGKISSLFLAGTTINRASLHNLAVIAEKDIRIGDRVKIKRAGDVIPYIIGPADPSKRTGQEQVIHPPSACPSCAGPLTETGDSRILVCTNHSGCPAQGQRRLQQWVSRASADIDALGEKWLSKLSEMGLVKRPSDLYRLDKQTLLEQFGGEGMGERLAEKLMESIEQSKQLGLRRALIGFSINLASEGVAKRICRAGYRSIEEVAAASPEQLAKVEDIGPAIAQSIHEHLNRPEVQEEIKRLREAGVDLDCLPEDGPVQAGDSPLAGKTVCITGTLSVSRKDFAALLEQAGANVVSSVSGKTDYLVAGENAGSKLAKAQQHGVRILSEDQARSMLR